MIIRHGHALEGRHAGGGEDLLFRPQHRNQPAVRFRQPQLRRQVFLHPAPGNRHVQADQIAFRLPPGDVLGKPCAKVDQDCIILSLISVLLLHQAQGSFHAGALENAGT